MLQSGGAKVPKFGSFKPRAASKVTPSETKHDEANGRVKRDRHSQQKRHSRHDHSSGDRRDWRNDTNHRRSRSRSPSQTQWESKEADPWMIDVRGDAQNVQFGSIHRYDIPSYRRAGRGSVIGVDPQVKIDRDLSTESEVVLRTTRGSKEFLSMLSLKADDLEQETTRMSPLAETEETLLDEDFVGFGVDHGSDRDQKPSAVGVGIWKFIEADAGSDGERG